MVWCIVSWSSRHTRTDFEGFRKRKGNGAVLVHFCDFSFRRRKSDKKGSHEILLLWTAWQSDVLWMEGAELLAVTFDFDQRPSSRIQFGHVIIEDDEIKGFSSLNMEATFNAVTLDQGSAWDELDSGLRRQDQYGFHGAKCGFRG